MSSSRPEHRTHGDDLPGRFRFRSSQRQAWGSRPVQLPPLLLALTEAPDGPLHKFLAREVPRRPLERVVLACHPSRNRLPMRRCQRNWARGGARGPRSHRRHHHPSQYACLSTHPPFLRCHDQPLRLLHVGRVGARSLRSKQCLRSQTQEW